VRRVTARAISVTGCESIVFMICLPVSVLV
jgi:hypothetical protein